MLQREIIRTCSHEKVAEAAILSIGASFRSRVELLSAASGLRPGAFVAALVRRFEEEGCDRDRVALRRATTGSDVPVLDGLRFIVELMIDGEGACGPRVRGARVPRQERRAHAA